MDPRDRLQRYWDKRDFAASPEPEGAGEPRALEGPMFVIQKHDARRLHYDFRLEADGVLKSWAVPKGPSTNPADKVLAVPTEDHPLGYAEFEGVIPRGQYGAGTVLVWDVGTYRNLTHRGAREIPVAEAIDNGHVSVWLEGRKLRGGYAFTRTRRGKTDSWLLVKMRDEAADARRQPTRTEPASVCTGRVLEEVAAEDA